MGYECCVVCGRRCGVNRTAGEIGYCAEGAVLRIAAAGLHRGEEPPVSGEQGSGTVFLSGCGLGCSFCQNRQISCGRMGTEIGVEEAAGIYLELQKRGAANVNFVTGTHFIPSVAESLDIAMAGGLEIPVVWNSSGFDTVEGLGIIDRHVGIYLPDVKTLDAAVAKRYFDAPEYPEVCMDAVDFMVRSKPLEFRDGTMVSGVIVRHLVLPGHLDATRRVIERLAARFGDRILLSIMVQYVPMEAEPGANVPAGRVSEREYDEIIDMLDDFGIEEGFIQEAGDSENWEPDFRKPNPFPEGFYDPVWHWREGALTRDR